ncbi:PucR family transcriptional regulator [Bacillus salinus]|uniref:PucR family transcriptional regulator n=1 Tax=Bacillus sp. HMF5848 TaxID=2495421 RepID=UPI00163A0A34|nr:helix-turn-helix domain-containing protein [Bacillus sp. HMF5848]
MTFSLQDRLLYIPLHQLTFLTPMPKEQIYYDSVSEYSQAESIKESSVLIFQDSGEQIKLYDHHVVTQLIKDPNVLGIVIYSKETISLQDDILALFCTNSIPILQVSELSSLLLFQQAEGLLYSYSQISSELIGFMEKGFPVVAQQIAMAIQSPLLYLDESHQLLWQTGKEEALREAKRWINTHMQDLENGIYSNEVNNRKKRRFNDIETMVPFELYSINIAGMLSQTLVVSADIVNWQKKLIDKLVGLTALLLQSEGMLQDQQEKFKQHFVYDILYHKFESQTELIKQGKTWGWNLERPHHLMIIHIDLANTMLNHEDWLNEIVRNIEIQNLNAKETLIVFPFQDQIVVLLEDGEEREWNQRKQFVKTIANSIRERLSSKWPQYHFYIGIGKWYQDTTVLNKSYQEAKLALQFGKKWSEHKNIYHINELGIIRLLSYIHHEILFDFSQEYLSLLEENDRDHGTEYIDTLKGYIRYQGVINDVSEALHVHPNTLRNRLKKIEEITGIDVQKHDEYINLIIAVKILSFIKY